ncbi:MAG: ankyrin repeat domain-containing protein [Pseudomonadota bacterium]
MEKINLIKALLDSGEIKSKELHQKNAAGKTPLDIARDITRLTGSSRPDPDYLELDSFFREKLAPRKIVIFGDDMENENFYFGSVMKLPKNIINTLSEEGEYDKQTEELAEYYSMMAEENPDIPVTTVIFCHGSGTQDGINMVKIGGARRSMPQLIKDIGLQENSVVEQFSCGAGRGFLTDEHDNQSQRDLKLAIPKRCFFVINGGKYSILSLQTRLPSKVIFESKDNSFFQIQIEKIARSSGTLKIIYKSIEGKTDDFKYNFPKEDVLRGWLEHERILPLLTKYIGDEIDRFFHQFCLKNQTELSEQEKMKMAAYVMAIKSKIQSNPQIIIDCAKSNIMRLILKEKPEYLRFYIEFMDILAEKDGVDFKADDEVLNGCLIELIFCMGSTKEKQSEMFDALFSGKLKLDPNKEYRDGTIFHRAIMCGNDELVQELLLKDADVNHKSRTNGMSAVHIVCQKGSANLVELFLEKADINLQTDGGKSALSLACDNKHLPVVQLIMRKVIRQLDNPDNQLEIFVADVKKILERKDLEYEIQTELEAFVILNNMPKHPVISQRQSRELPPAQQSQSPNSDPQPLAGVNSGRSVVVVEDKNGKKCPPPCNVL